MRNPFAPLLLLFAALPLLAAPMPIFDGKSLDGWEGDAKWWRVEDAALTGGSRSEKVPRNFFLATTKSYQNFDLRLKLKLTGDPKTGMINSGVQIRSLRVPNNTEMSGYQVDAGEGWWGKMYDESRRNRVIAQAANLAAVNAAVNKDDWNEFRIRTEGPRIQSWINGVPALDYTEPDPNVAQDGRIAVQIHSGGMAVVQVKEVTIEELPPIAGAPTWESLGGVEAARAKIAPPKKEAAAPATTKSGRDISYNTIGSTPRTPEEERAAFKLPDGFEVELVAAEDPANGIGKFVPIAFDQKGALWTTTALEYPVDGNENPAAADALYASKAKDKVLVYDRDPSQPTGYSPKARVFAEGLAIPLGVLPYKGGCYVQHGHDIVFLSSNDEARLARLKQLDPAGRFSEAIHPVYGSVGNGPANDRQVVLTGFGVQDSHLFPHQFLRAPGGWIWMAQGAFNYSEVSRPGDEKDAVQFDQTRMAKFRSGGEQFTITSNGPCNIWGLVLNGEGDAFIQEANDFGYPVMPFHEYANYPGCSDRQWKSYAPEFPGTAPDFKMGGTGLSGLALTDKNGPFPELWRDVMLVANPITNRIQGIKMHRDGPYWKLDKPVDFLVSEDPWFRPVAITIGPDGCLYIVDWYNKIISHNEVPRNHPDRDKTRGRIWRVKAKAQPPFDVPDLATLSSDELIAKLGGASLVQSHLAWQTLGERRADDALYKKLEKIVRDQEQPAARRIQALWTLQEFGQDNIWITQFPELARDKNPVIRRALARAERDNNHYTTLENAEQLAPLANDSDPEVRAAVICALGNRLRESDNQSDDSKLKGVERLLAMAKGPLAEPTTPSTRNGKPIKVREAYDREFERYLIRQILERVPRLIATYLDSDAAKPLPVEAYLLASLALDPKASAARVAKLLPQLQRAPGQEEVLRLAQFPDEPGVGEALRAVLSNPKTCTASLESLLAVKTRLDATKLAPFLTDAATALLASKDATALDLGVRLTSGFALRGAEPALVALAQSGPQAPAALRALGELGSPETELFARLIETSSDALQRDEALAALANSKATDAPQRVFTLYPKLTAAQRKTALERLSTTKHGASTILAALDAGKLAKTDLDASTLDRLQAVLGANDPTLLKLMDSLGALFQPVLLLDGSDAAWTQTNLTLDGPCTIEAWVRLDPEKRKIGNVDGIAGAPGQLDINFFAETARVYAFPPLGDVTVAKKAITPGLWTHVAATRDGKGIWKIFIDGELSATGNKPAPHKIENLRLAWTAANGGPRGALSEVRVWNRERTADEIRTASDRRLPATTPGLIFTTATGDWGQLQAGAKIARTSDFPPILSGDEAAALDAKYAKFRALAEKPGDAGKGKVAAILCQACHLFGTTGGNIGPNLSGVGAMGAEAILRNILQPNAAMENGYRIYRVELKSGDLIDALFVSEDKDAVVVRLPGSEDRRLAKKEIRDAKFLRRSLMPEGLLDTMTPEQISDLFAYFRTLK